MTVKHQAFYSELKNYIPESSLYTDPMKTLAYGTDASFYRMNPQIVVKTETEEDIQTVIRLAKKHQVSITYRAAGTSLSGQSVTDSVLVIMGDKWKKGEVLNDGLQIRLKPGIIGAHANNLLKKYLRKIGPDPASIGAAQIGGIAANNSSGMCCGIKENGYHTLNSMRVILMDGTVLDTSKPENVAAFRISHAALLNELSSLSNRIKSDKELEEKVRHKYRLKNTTGYGINSLLDFEDPIEMLIHLFIGSEGTLGFISEIVFNTVHDYKDKASALILFDELDRCCHAVTALRDAGEVEAVELIDSRSIAAIQDKKNLPAFMYEAVKTGTTAILIEVRNSSPEGLDKRIEAVNKTLADFNANHHSGFSKVPEVYANYWQVRSGLFPAVGAVRPVGTTVLIEDVAFPIKFLAEGVRSLNELFAKYKYNEALIFGHALEGNLHFVFTQDFSIASEVERYDAFMTEVNDLVVDVFGGSLKAEHGTGRNVAPFVKKEWGDAAYEVMCDIKKIFDPENLLNPDVIISNNKKIHLENLKALPAADDIIDKCIECGYCEPVCPSTTLTLTPRQRITVWRRIQDLKRTGKDPKELAALEKEYQYMAIDTCATCGMCATKCPVGIDTGKLTKKLKGAPSNPKLFRMAENNFATMMGVSGFGLTAVNAIEKVTGKTAIEKLSKGLNDIIGTPYLPTKGLPKGAGALPKPAAKSGKEVIYLVSCVNRMMGEGRDGDTHLASHTLYLLEKAGYKVSYPPAQAKLCCGQPFSSQNDYDLANKMLSDINTSLLEATRNGEVPVYLDNSSCSVRIIDAQKQGLVDSRLKLFDALTLLHTFVAPQLSITKKFDKLALHVPCSVTKMGVSKQLIALSELCTNELIVPEIACCGFAGVKGFSTPELNANSLRNLKDSLPDDCNKAVSTSRLCQIGLSHHTGLDYQSVEALLRECVLEN